MILQSRGALSAEHEQQRSQIDVRNFASILGFCLTEAAILTAREGRWIGTWPKWQGDPPTPARWILTRAQKQHNALVTRLAKENQP